MFDLLGLALAGVVVLGSLAVAKWYFPRRFARDDRARRVVPSCAVRDLVAGARVRVIGTAHGLGEPLLGPHTGKPCLAYEARAYDAKLELKETSRTVAFRVQDDTGSIVVGVDHVKLDLVPDLTHEKKFGAGVIARNTSDNLTAAFLWEHALRPEMRVAVIGRVARVDNAVVLVGTADEPVVISTWHASFEP